jgi:CubicO group peptidase (beta-lactamase class C family)
MLAAIRFFGALIGVGMVFALALPSWSAPEVSLPALDALDRFLAGGKCGRVDDFVLMSGSGKVSYERHYLRDYTKMLRGAPGEYNYTDPRWHPYYRATSLHSLQSVTKTVMGALIGIALQRREIASLDVPVERYFRDCPEWGSDPRRAVLTLRHLLTMRSGIRWDEESAYTDPGNDWAGMERSDDWIRYVLGKGMASRPGERFVYSSGDAVLLDRVLWRATGKHADEYAREHLFKPLGIRDFYWKKTRTGTVDTEGGLYLTARDLGKIGALYAVDGVWDGLRVLPAGWVQASVEPRSIGDDDWKFGFEWWLIPHGEGRYAPTSLGYGGQRLILIPERDAVVVFTGWNVDNPSVFTTDQALARVLDALR